ncbi:MAG: 7-cyano-7-deazaguanine synthase [Epsilonproteobacteria bacterium]|nr:MAG: 7-cyano-7-deazaguanine synthase [Campylobacterota bacterium]
MICLLLSGGLDSLSILYWKRPKMALTIDYGQNSAKAEIEASRYACSILDIDHHILNIDCSILGSGDMSKDKPNELAPNSDWWPFRNQLLVTFASMYVIKYNINTIMIGSVKPDNQFKDGTAEFTKLINNLTIFQEGKIKIEAPAIDLTSKELINISGIPLSLLCCAHSCHYNNSACSMCRGCNKYTEIMDKLQ